MDNSELIEKKHREFTEKLNDPNFAAKLIAAYIRNNIEEFHGTHLNNSQMKELNLRFIRRFWISPSDPTEHSFMQSSMSPDIGRTANMWNH